MKRHAATILLTLLLLFPTASFAQNSQNGTSPVPDKSKVIAVLLKEVDAGRDYIAQLEKREAALVEELKRADESHAALTEAHKAALVELGELRATIKFQKAALDEREKQVGTLRAERDEERKANKSLRRENLILKLGYLAKFLIGSL